MQEAAICNDHLDAGPCNHPRMILHPDFHLLPASVQQSVLSHKTTGHRPGGGCQGPSENDSRKLTVFKCFVPSTFSGHANQYYYIIYQLNIT